MTIRQFELEVQNRTIEMIEIVDDNGNATQMTKARWDELEAQREQSGTL